MSGSKCTVSARFLHGFKTCKGCKSLQNRTKGAETRSSKPAMYRKEITSKRNFQKLRESPGVRYESVGRGFESLPSHQEKPVHIVCWFFFFVCAMEGARTGRRRIAPQAISPVQQRRPQPAAETGRSCWGPRSDFSKPCQGAAEKSANATRCCCLARGFQRVGMSTGRTAAEIENPNFFPIGEGFGFFVFFGNESAAVAQQ